MSKLVDEVIASDTYKPNTVNGKTREAKTQIAIWIGQFYTNLEIVKLYRHVYNKEINPRAVMAIREAHRWQDFIEAQRGIYVKQVAKIPIANKIVRLRRLESMFQKAREEEDEGRALDVLREARAECEGEAGLKALAIITDAEHMTGIVEELKAIAQLERERQGGDINRPADGSSHDVNKGPLPVVIQNFPTPESPSVESPERVVDKNFEKVNQVVDAEISEPKIVND